MNERNNTKNWIKIILFVISFVPYAFTLFCAINNSINGVKSGFLCISYCEYVYGSEAFWDTMQVLALLFSYFLIGCLIYQIHFIIEVSQLVKKTKSRKKANCIFIGNENNMKRWGLFIISFVPFIILLYFAISNAIYGASFCDKYGLDAFLFTFLISLPFSPILICCLIYQINLVFKTTKVKNKKK